MNTVVQPRSAPQFSLENNAVLLDKFTACKQAELFDTLKQIQFNGQLVLTENRGQQWNFHLRRGKILYVTGGMHFVRRWLRNMAIVFPDVDANFSALQEELQVIDKHQEDYLICWQYQLLSSWVQQKKITLEQANKIIWLIFVEILFDLAQADKITYELKQETWLQNHHEITAIDIRQAIAEAHRQSELWQTAKIQDFSSNQVPVIKQVEQLRRNTSNTVYQSLTQLLDGQKTIKDLAVEMSTDVVVVAKSLLPFVELGLVELTNIPDAIAPVITQAKVNFSRPQTPLIACVDDSPFICHVMQKILSEAGYQYLGFNDPFKSINVLLALKPDLIFLDLIMPNINGYEVCKRLRTYSYLKNTPIIILTANDNLIDRVKARLIGASGFLSKTKVNQKQVIEVISKHLQHHAIKKIDSANLRYQSEKEAVRNQSQFKVEQSNGYKNSKVKRVYRGVQIN
jgi:two-component system, chemotaxis family, response regulator PixG